MHCYALLGQYEQSSLSHAVTDHQPCFSASQLQGHLTNAYPVGYHIFFESPPATVLSHHEFCQPSVICMQDMNFDSVPFEEPELFRARSGLRPALKSLAKDCASLELQLDSQAPLDKVDKCDQA